jgi:ammonium transporter, Amt family
MIAQGAAVGATLLWSGVGSAILYKIVDLTIGPRPEPDQKRADLDIFEHRERAYDL